MSENTEIWEGTVLTVRNRHIKMAGKPPDLLAEGYTAYYENTFGEQCVFMYDYALRRGTLWVGDYSWEKPIEVRDGRPYPATLIISDDEYDWLKLVWETATRRG